MLTIDIQTIQWNKHLYCPNNESVKECIVGKVHLFPDFVSSRFSIITIEDEKYNLVDHHNKITYTNLETLQEAKNLATKHFRLEEIKKLHGTG